MACLVAAGDVIGGKFRVERVIGKGGMGVVVEAMNTQLDQKVALKLLARDTENPAVVERFTHEAKAAARLRSEHVARVFDVGKDPVHGPFIVMELLEGQTLAGVLTTSGRVTCHRAVEYVIDACEGLAEAHARGIVHQDVKPANLFLVTGDDGRPTVKLLDFGIASMRSNEPLSESNGKSSAPRSLGTPAYFSPEQLRSGTTVDHRSDVWALGVVLYELLSNEKPFRATRFTELVTKILEANPDPFPPDLIDVPSALVAVIERCLEKDRTKRFNSTGELALALLPFARRRAHSSVSRAVAHVKTGGIDPHLQMPSSMPPPPADSASDLGGSGSISQLRTPTFPSIPQGIIASAAPPPARSRLPLAIALLFGVVALAGGAFAVVRSTSAAPPPPPVGQATTPAREALTVAAPEVPPTPNTAVTLEAPTPAEPAPVAVPVRRPIFKPGPGPAQRPSPGPAPASTEAEIRHSR